jgi:hypothetical protein
VYVAPSDDIADPVFRQLTPTAGSRNGSTVRPTGETAPDGFTEVEKNYCLPSTAVGYAKPEMETAEGGSTALHDLARIAFLQERAGDRCFANTLHNRAAATG